MKLKTLQMNLSTYLLGETPGNRVQNIGLLLLRLLFCGALIYSHGWPTFSSFLSGNTGFPDPLGLGPGLSKALTGSAEFIFALLVLIGAGTRLAVIPVFINFLTAFLIFHTGDPFTEKELAYLYLASITCIGLLGPGRYSLDYYYFKWKQYPT